MHWGSVQSVRSVEGVELQLYFFMTYGTRREWGVIVTPQPLFTPWKTRYRTYSGLGGQQDRYGHVRKISPPPGFDPRTVQPVTRRCTDWATRLTIDDIVFVNLRRDYKNYLESP
jgi:hypothetical protein